MPKIRIVYTSSVPSWFTSAQALTTVDVSATTSATLYPGATGDLELRIDNPNPYPVRVTSVSGSGAIASDKGAACDASTGVVFTNQTGLTLDVPASSAVTVTPLTPSINPYWAAIAFASDA